MESGRNLYVASLPIDFTEERLWTLFQPFGPIESVKLGTDTSGMCKGYGFVLFKMPCDAKTALDTMIGYVVDGNRIQVRWSKNEPNLRNSAAQPTASAQEDIIVMLPNPMQQVVLPPLNPRPQPSLVVLPQQILQNVNQQLQFVRLAQAPSLPPVQPNYYAHQQPAQSVMYPMPNAAVQQIPYYIINQAAQGGRL